MQHLHKHSYSTRQDRLLSLAGLRRACLAAMLAGVFPAAAMAQNMSSNIVLPPAPPPGVAPAKANEVIPPQQVSSAAVGAPAKQPHATVVKPVAAAPAASTPAAAAPAASVASAAPTPSLVDVMLPPAPERAPVPDLNPGAPAIKKSAKSKPKAAPKAPPKETSEAAVGPKLDPFAGLVGTPVSDSQLNRFVFPEEVEGVFFQEGAPLPECPQNAGEKDPCKPVFLNGRRMMLLQLRAGAQGLVQMLVHLRSGRVVTLNLAPTRGPGAIVRIDGAEDGASDTRLAQAKAAQVAQASGAAQGGMAATEQNVTLLSRFAKGDIPPGYEAMPLKPPVRYDLFDVVPMATWANGAGMAAHLYQVRSRGEHPIAINPGLFRHPGVKALALDRDTITLTAPAMLYVLEQAEDH